MSIVASVVPQGSASYAQKSAAEVEAEKIKAGEYPMNTVLLNVYDIVGANTILHGLGIGVHHTGVEVFGTEYAFGRCKNGTGVFSIPPKQCPGHVFRESIVVGTTNMSCGEVKAMIDHLSLMEEWMGAEYHILRKNCNIFSEFFCSSIVTSPSDMAGINNPIASSPSRMKAASDSRLYTQSSSSGTGGKTEDGLDSIAAAEPPLGAEASSIPAPGTTTTASPARRRPNTAGSPPRKPQTVEDFSFTPKWTNRIARVADFLLPGGLIDKIEESDRKAQGM